MKVRADLGYKGLPCHWQNRWQAATASEPAVAGLMAECGRAPWLDG